jgi:D-glycero-D-manno-heptose 1,7-bisphosphate phosphatase
MARKTSELHRAVFLDRDGVLNFDTGYTYRLADLRLLPGVSQALTQLKQGGFQLIVVSNQSGVARGKFAIADVEAFHQAMNSALRAEGGPVIDEFLYCPHHPEGSVAEFAVVCSCRKPEPGMIVAAAQRHGLTLRDSFLVGDKSDDIEAATRAGVRGIQVRSRYGPPHPSAMALVDSLEEAVPLILSQ